MYTYILQHPAFALLRRIAALPVLREVLGAVVGMTVALSLYGVFNVAHSLLTNGVVAVVSVPLHGAATLVVTHASVLFGLLLLIVLAAASAFLHRRMMSEID